MFVNCETCHRNYDDAVCWTVCPHGPLWATVDAYCREHDLVNCTLHTSDEPARVEKHIAAYRLELTPEQRQGLTTHVDSLPAYQGPAPTERRLWYDELEEEGWTKQTEADGSTVYQRPLYDGFEKQTFRADGGWGYSRPIAPGIVVQIPDLQKKQGWWQRLCSMWNRCWNPQAKHAALPRSFWNR